MVEIPEKLKKLQFFVGNTPTLRLYCEFEGKKVDILAKYEAWNFSGSVKDRMALQILKSAYNLGLMSPGDTIVEATSGNTGIAFAAMGAYLGHPVEIYMPKWLSEERKQLLRFYGAKLIEISEKQGGFMECIARADKKSQKKGFFGPKQFENSWNVLAHQRTTAPEIHNALKLNKIKSLDAFVTGVGTGGTVMGVYHYFSQIQKDFQAFPVLPTKNSDGGHRIEGIGDSFIPKILDLDSLGSIIRIKDSDAISLARQLNKIGLSVGISSGANVFASIIKSISLGSEPTVATILCDDNKKYLSTDLCSDSNEELSQDVKVIDFEIIA